MRFFLINKEIAKLMVADLPETFSLLTKFHPTDQRRDRWLLSRRPGSCLKLRLVRSVLTHC